MVIAFWLLLVTILYVTFGYGLLALGLVRLGFGYGGTVPTPDRAKLTSSPLPMVSLVIAACDEEDVIEAKLDNTRALDYPADKLQVLVVTDGSTDRTAEIVSAAPDVEHLHIPERRGKLAAVNRAVRQATGDVLVFSDANGFFNTEALLNLVRHFADPQVGCVAGEKRVRPEVGSTSGEGEGLYWRYESFLKKVDAKLHSACGAAGEIFAVRRELFVEVPPDSIIEDFHLSLDIARRGHRIAYDPDAFAVEGPTTRLGEEFKRRTRIAQGGYQSVWRLRALLNPFRYGWLSFCFLSHRVLRWCVQPIALVGVAVLAPLIWLTEGDPFYLALTLAQAGFYIAAMLGWLFERAGRKPAIFYYPYYFTLINVTALVGCILFLVGGSNVVWTRAERAPATHRDQ